MELTYTMQGDYLLPDLSLPETPTLGKYGMMRRSHLKQHRPALYSALRLAGKLDAHLMEIDQTARQRMELLTRQMAEREGATEDLKARNQMEWLGLMNNIRNRAEELVLTDLIYS